MRFRVAEDEARYNALRVEAYLRLAQLPPAIAGEVLRNWSKIEALVFWEGVRQGLAIATIHTLEGRSFEHSAALAHAAVYGDADTPLADVESERVESAFAGLYEAREAAMQHPWLSAQPVEFAPQTLAEAAKRYREAPEASAPTKIPAPAPVATPTATTATNDEPDWSDDDLEAIMAEEQATLASRGADLPGESPSFLDRVRDELLVQTATGWKPSGWPDLIMRLHLALQVDASYLDLQLSSEMGRTVLAQAGIHDVLPGLGVLAADDGSFGGVRERT